MSTKKITIFQYIANHVPSAIQAKKIIEDHGYRVDFRDEPGFVLCMHQFINEEQKRGNGEKAMLALAKAHPDRELILESAETVKMNFDGFADSILNSQNKEKPVVIVPPVQQEFSKQDHTPLLMIGLLASALFLSVAIISKNS